MELLKKMRYGLIPYVMAVIVTNSVIIEIPKHFTVIPIAVKCHYLI